MMQKKILDATCGSRTIWFNKQHPAAIYCDVRSEECTGIWKSTKSDSERTCIIRPDIQCDFTALPFPDNTFSLVVFDHPHLRRVGENAWMRKKYGQLGGYTAPQDLQIRTIQHVSPVRMTSVQTINYLDLERTRAYPYAVQRAKDQIAADLVKTMQRTGIIAFSVQQRHTGDVEVRGTVLLYPLDGLEVPPC